MSLELVNSRSRNSQIIINSTTKADKRYIIDRDVLERAASLGEGMSGRVIKMKCKIEELNQTKEKHYALKRFYSLFNANDKIEEFDCHQEIMFRLIQYRPLLCHQGIAIGTGIEKKPIFAFSLERSHHIMKKLYDKNLDEAIQQGYFQKATQLLEGAKQLLEGIFSLMTIGALYFDIKPANILVGRKDRFELAFTDFEKISFLRFDQTDDEVIQSALVRMPPILAHKGELDALIQCRFELQSPAQEFLARLHKLYSFAMGAVFFEMATQMSLRTFVFVKYFTLCTEKNGTPISSIDQFWEKAKNVRGANIVALKDVLDEKNQQPFLELVKHKQFPDLELMELKEVQQGLVEYLQTKQVPEFFIKLVTDLLQTKQEMRIEIGEALKILHSNLPHTQQNE